MRSAGRHELLQRATSGASRPRGSALTRLGAVVRAPSARPSAAIARAGALLLLVGCGGGGDASSCERYVAALEGCQFDAWSAGLAEDSTLDAPPDCSADDELSPRDDGYYQCLEGAWDGARCDTLEGLLGGVAAAGDCTLEAP
jgi:hypothetical protein